MSDAPPYTSPPPRLLDRVRLSIRARHYSRRTEKAYLAWIRRYILFHDKRHPGRLGAPEVTTYLSHLASTCHVSASTQNQAFAALLLAVAGGVTGTFDLYRFAASAQTIS